MQYLPDTVREIAEVIGEENALHLIANLPTFEQRDSRYPNSRRIRNSLYVPKRLSADHWLVSILGFDLAQRLVEGFGGENLKPANCNAVKRAERDQEIRRRAGQGEKPADLARAFQLTERRIRGLTREIPREAIVAANDQ